MGGALCNDAVLAGDATPARRLHAIGDPTEGALVIAAARFGLFQNVLNSALPRVSEAPFDSERKRMTTVHRVDDCAHWVGECVEIESTQYVGFTKGGVDNLIEVSTKVWDNGRAVEMDENWRSRILEANTELAGLGMRVLGVAFRTFSGHDGAEFNTPASMERDLVFVGLVGMIDPPRAEVGEAITVCKRAGIRPVMITGDHPLTARKIALDLGIMQGGRVLSGPELSGMDSGDLRDAVDDCSVYARVAPEQKLRIVEALQARGHVVAMTGDGVNDAPALRRADIGVAMGITGTDVSKEAAAMVLLDDNFSTIVAAVEEGRAIYDNIRRFLLFSLAGNIGKLILVLCGPLLGMPLPLTPFQILWLNLVTDGLLGLGIGVEPAEPDTMHRPPRPPSEGILAGGLGMKIAVIGTILGIANLAVTYSVWKSGSATWQTIGLLTVVLLQIVAAYAYRAWSVPVYKMRPFSNKALLAVIILVLALQALIIYLPMLRPIFGTVALPLGSYLEPLGAGAIVLILMEGMKQWSKRDKNE
jgi:Ca2+-transporting ATPase